jgi:hypothetical protein
MNWLVALGETALLFVGYLALMAVGIALVYAVLIGGLLAFCWVAAAVRWLGDVIADGVRRLPLRRSDKVH